MGEDKCLMHRIPLLTWFFSLRMNNRKFEDSYLVADLNIRVLPDSS